MVNDQDFPKLTGGLDKGGGLDNVEYSIKYSLFPFLLFNRFETILLFIYSNAVFGIISKFCIIIKAFKTSM